VEEIDRLKQRGDISVHDYTLLRFSLDARTALVELTYNEPDAFAEGTVEQILERSHAIARQEAEAERDAACTALVAEQEGRRKAEERAERAEKASEERSRELRRKRSENSARLAHYVGWGFTVVASLALVFASVVTSGADIPFLPAGQVRVAVTFIVVVVFNVASAGTLISGLSLAAVRTRLENRMARVIERLLNHITPLDV
jgi:hypothetical protein